MNKLRYIIYPLIILPLFIVFVWLFAIPEDLIKTTIEDSILNQDGLDINVSIKGLKKGIFFTVFADSFELKKGETPALIITDISGRINPLHLLKKQMTFSVNGKIGTGELEGFFKLPGSGTLKVNQAEFNAIPFLRSIGLNLSGLVSADLNLKNNVIHVSFKTSHVDIQDSAIMIPLPLKSFQTIQGALYLQDNTVKITSISLEGDKGYARIKGDVTNGFMNLILELMPSTDELKPIESMLISKYQISPGYYVIPIEGPLL